jgi:hypothetical protein
MFFIYCFWLILIQFNTTHEASSITYGEILVPHYEHIYGKIRIDEETLYLGEYQRYQELSQKVFLETVSGKSCAVVGSSSNLIGSNYGSFIDSHDVVFRINDAPVEERYAKDIGSKTNVWFINVHDASPGHQDFKLDSKYGNQFFMISPSHPELNKSFSRYYNQTFLWRTSEINTLSKVSRDKIENISGGLKALYYAMSLCQNVSVFGFGVDKFGKRGCYDNLNLLFSWEQHRPDKQDLLIQELAKQKQINLYMGNAEKAK